MGEELYAQLHAKGDEAEPARIGAAYKLAALGEIEDVMLKKLFGVATQKEFSAKS